MNTQNYSIECDETGYCIVGTQGILAHFNSAEAAFKAVREFNLKSFPKNWAKVPPATLHAKQLYYGI